MSSKRCFFLFLSGMNLARKGVNKVRELVERINKDGQVLGEGVLKVDSFVTHQVDPVLMEQMGQRFAEVFKRTKGITKVVTIRSFWYRPSLYLRLKSSVYP